MALHTTPGTTHNGDTNAAPPLVHTWANGFGIWHVRVGRGVTSPLIAARRALRDELHARDTVPPKTDRNVWLHPERVPALDNVETVVYREGTPVRGEH